MRMQLRPVSAIVLAAALAAMVATYKVSAAQQPTAQDPMPALLAEVRALRIAMQQAATVAPRVQLALARLNIEEQRISQLAAQLDQVRRELTAASLESQKLSDELPGIEQGLQSTDEKIRRSSEAAQTWIKQKLAAQSRLEQQLRIRENEAAQALGTEQARWIDLNTRLDELERLLGPIPG